MEISKYIRNLQKSHLFKNMCEERLIKTFNKLDGLICDYYKGDIIINEGDKAHYLGIILVGEVDLKKKFFSDFLRLVTLKEGETFGEAVMFSQNFYTATVIAKNNVKILFLSNKELDKIMEMDRKLYAAFLKVMYKRLQYFKDRINHYESLKTYN